MKWTEEIEVELATHLAGNITLYNQVMDAVKAQKTEIDEWSFKHETATREVEKLKEVDFQNKTQIANLVNRLPMFTTEGEKKKEVTSESIIDSINNMELEGL